MACSEAHQGVTGVLIFMSARQVESNVVVPVERASKVQERSAAGLRRKLTPHLDTFLQPVPEHPVEHKSMGLDLPQPPDLLDVSVPHALLETLSVDRSVPHFLNLREGSEWHGSSDEGAKWY
jgi:deoxyribodipyrimidine photo-lyase